MKIPQFHAAGTAFANVKFTFCLVTPEQAAEWLKCNHKNRNLRERALEAYMQDMRNGAWLTTAECIQFDEDGNLMNGQHRLEAIVRTKKPVLMVISSGWPAKQGKNKTMDGVDRGAGRSIADQLYLQHGIEKREAANVVRICNMIACSALGLSRVSSSTPDSILAVLALYKGEIEWMLANPIKEHGIKQAMVLACLVMGRSVWADKMEQFLERLMTGENLTRESPILHLRNWLMGDGSREDNSLLRQVMFHHMAAFKDGKSLPQVVVNSSQAYIRMMILHKVRVVQICKIYGGTLPEFLADEATVTKSNGSAGAFSPGAIKIAETLGTVFSTTDLMARTDENVGQLLMSWKNKGWIESVGAREFRKTDKFGKL